MKSAEFHEAMEIARSKESLDCADDSPLHGLALPEFQPVTVSLRAIAKFLRWHCICFNGEDDSNAVNEMANLMRRRVIVA